MLAKSMCDSHERRIVEFYDITCETTTCVLKFIKVRAFNSSSRKRGHSFFLFSTQLGTQGSFVYGINYLSKLNKLKVASSLHMESTYLSTLDKLKVSSSVGDVEISRVLFLEAIKRL